MRELSDLLVPNRRTADNRGLRGINAGFRPIAKADGGLSTSRRGFITGLTALIVAPAIVRASNLMPVKSFDPFYRRYIADYIIATDQMIMRVDVARFPLPSPSWKLSYSESEAFNLIPQLRKIVKDMQPCEGEQQSAQCWLSDVHEHVGNKCVPIMTYDPILAKLPGESALV